MRERGGVDRDARHRTAEHAQLRDAHARIGPLQEVDIVSAAGRSTLSRNIVRPTAVGWYDGSSGGKISG